MRICILMSGRKRFINERASERERGQQNNIHGTGRLWNVCNLFLIFAVQRGLLGKSSTSLRKSMWARTLKEEKKNYTDSDETETNHWRRFPEGEGGTSWQYADGMCHWIGSHFHDWIDHNGVASSIKLLEWSRTFSESLVVRIFW